MKQQLFCLLLETACNWILIAPSLPSFMRLYLYDTATFQPIDYVQLYKEDDKWFFDYRFTHYYSMPNISTFSLQLLVKRMEEVGTWFLKYVRSSAHNYTNSGTNICRTGSCVKFCLCSVVALDYSAYIECMSEDSAGWYCEVQQNISNSSIRCKQIFIFTWCIYFLTNNNYFLRCFI